MRGQYAQPLGGSLNRCGSVLSQPVDTQLSQLFRLAGNQRPPCDDDHARVRAELAGLTHQHLQGGQLPVGADRERQHIDPMGRQQAQHIGGTDPARNCGLKSYNRRCKRELPTVTEAKSISSDNHQRPKVRAASVMPFR